MKRLLILSTLTLFLASCNEVQGPYSLDANILKNVDLKAHQPRGGRLQLREGEKHVVSVSLAKKQVQIDFELGSVVFSKAQWDSSGQNFSSLPGTSGQFTADGEALGLRGHRRLLCNPECQRVIRQRYYEACTYYVTRSREHCDRDRYGNVHCRRETVTIPIQGRQEIEQIQTLSTFDLGGSIYGADNSSYVDFSGQAEDSRIERRPLSPCH